MKNPIIEAIYSRRSIREFSDAPVCNDDLQEIVKAGIWAPSGLNNQPWRFKIIQDRPTVEKLAKQTHYSHIVLAAQALIAVYLEVSATYDEVKDHQSTGACIQNMLLAAEALELGGVWLGQILKNKIEVNDILGLSNKYDLMAVIALGHPLHHNQKSTRKELNDFLL